MTVPQVTPMLVGFEGTRLDQTLQHHLLKINPAGVVLFRRNIVSLPQTRELVRDIRDLLGPVLVAMDHEGGIVNRFPPDCPSPPSPMALCRSGDAELLREACRMQAELLAFLGINLNLAPVLDLAAAERNPAIGTRAFSEDPGRVAGYARAFLEAHESAGIGCTAKHFPGHGRSASDTHTAAGRVTADYHTLWETDLLPFREAISGGIPAVMPAHLVYPALDPTVPATFSYPVIGELLRKRLGFQGLVISDCVEMAAIADFHSPFQIVQQGLQAGIDLFISSFSLKRSCSFQVSLKEALDRAAAEPRVAFAVTGIRLQRFRKRYAAASSQQAEFAMDPQAVAAAHRRTIEKKRTTAGLRGCRGFFLLELAARKTSSGINSGSPAGPVAADLSSRLDAVRRFRSLDDCNLPALAEVMAEAGRQHLCIVLITTSGHEHAGFETFLHTLEKAPQTIHIALTDERDLQGRFSHEWVTWGFNAWTAAALALELEALVWVDLCHISPDAQ